MLISIVADMIMTLKADLRQEKQRICGNVPLVHLIDAEMRETRAGAEQRSPNTNKRSARTWKRTQQPFSRTRTRTRARDMAHGQATFGNQGAQGKRTLGAMGDSRPNKRLYKIVKEVSDISQMHWHLEIFEHHQGGS